MEKFPTINSESLSQDSKQAGNKDIEFPEFNKAEAEENIKAYEAEHNEVQKNIETEQLCVPDKMMEQLEQLGVNQEILKNPTFNEILTDNMKYYGLQMCVPNTIEASEDKVHSGENIGEKQFSLSYSGEKGDSRYHDRGNMNIIVKEDGSLVLECACADRNKVEAKKDAFKGYEASGDYIDTIETRNNASITEFRITQDGWLATYERSVYEHQLQPASPSPSGGRNFGLYTRSMAECNRYFDVAGIEQYREDVFMMRRI